MTYRWKAGKPENGIETSLLEGSLCVVRWKVGKPENGIETSGLARCLYRLIKVGKVESPSVGLKLKHSGGNPSPDGGSWKVGKPE